MKKILLLLFVLVVIGYAGTNWLSKQIHNPLPIESNVIIELPQGANVRTLATALTAQKLVYHPLIVRFAARILGYDKRLKAGEYELEPNMTLAAVFEKISSGKVVMHRLTLPEGLTSTQILTLIAQNEFLKGEISEPVAEGEIFPETYTFPKGFERNQLIRQAKNAMVAKLNEVWEKRDTDLPLNSPRELLILASIIEKETGVGSERAKVASVFVNRLNAGMLLQTDPTVIYALTLGKEDLGRALTRKDLEVDSPYNTYKNIGLPPTPIANPGIKALEAAAHPEKTPFFYFVADGNGGHNFAVTLAEHHQNVQNWKKKIRNR